jgi:membrane protease YdiL (CAAX protease family)
MASTEHASPFARLTARRIILWVILATTVASIATIVIGSAIAGVTYDPAEDERATAILTSIATVLVILVLARRAGLDWRRLMGPPVTRETLPLALILAPVALLTFAAALATYIPLSYLSPGFVDWLLEPRLLFQATSPGQWVLLMLAGVIAAPIVEEILFRGILLQRWATKWGTARGVIASSALFAMLHQEWVGHFLFGVALSLLYLRTRSLWVPMVAHAANNFVFLLPSLRQALDHTREKAQTIPELRAEGIWIVPLLIAGLALGWLYRRKYWAPGQLASVLRGPIPYAQNEERETESVRRLA